MGCVMSEHNLSAYEIEKIFLQRTKDILNKARIAYNSADSWATEGKAILDLIESVVLESELACAKLAPKE